MTRFSERYPHELSGGQQQRVALARTLVYDPAILLLDEPLSNLDAKLRERARVWLSQLHRAIKRTTVYVTHDQTEALALSDRIIVMNEGRIVQIGTPQEIYEHPAEPFVADFIGTSSFLKGTLRRAGAEFSDIELEDGTMMQAGTTPGIAPGTKITIAVRPERLTLTRSNQGPVGETGTLIPAAVQANSYLGARYQYELEIAGAVVRTESPERFSDQNIGVWMPASACVLFAQSAA
jgi:iron(III) transport system ATP-binding protein